MKQKRNHALNFNENCDIAENGIEMLRFFLWWMPVGRRSRCLSLAHHRCVFNTISSSHPRSKHLYSVCVRVYASPALRKSWLTSLPTPAPKTSITNRHSIFLLHRVLQIEQKTCKSLQCTQAIVTMLAPPAQSASEETSKQKWDH